MVDDADQVDAGGRRAREGRTVGVCQAEQVVCDGRQHAVAVNVIGGPLFDAGKALAQATLTAPSGTDEDVKVITIFP